MKLESTKVTVSKPANQIVESLNNIQNYSKLMPENISKFEVLDDKSFIFALKGMPDIKLKLQESTEKNQIVLGSSSKSLSFSLKSNIIPVDEDKSEVQLFFEGNFNPMIEMMIKGPIKNFIGTLVSNMHLL